MGFRFERLGNRSLGIPGGALLRQLKRDRAGVCIAGAGAKLNALAGC
jgi:hypothetical protein